MLQSNTITGYLLQRFSVRVYSAGLSVSASGSGAVLQYYVASILSYSCLHCTFDVKIECFTLMHASIQFGMRLLVYAILCVIRYYKQRLDAVLA